MTDSFQDPSVPHGDLAFGRAGATRFTYPLLAWRYMRARQAGAGLSLVAGFSIFAVALGVATLVVVMGIYTGVRQVLLSGLVESEGDYAVLPLSPSALASQRIDLLAQPDSQSFALKEALVSSEDFLLVPVLQKAALLRAGNQARVLVLRGMDAEARRRAPLIARYLVAGDAAGNGLLIGERLALQLGVGLGDSVTLLALEPDRESDRAGATGSETPEQVSESRQSLSVPVVGFFRTGLRHVDEGMAILDRSQVEALSGDSGVSRLQFFATDLDDSARLLPELERLANHWPPAWTAYDMRQVGQGLYGWIRDEQRLIETMVALIVMVALFGVVNGQLMLVGSKRREIAVLRSFGAQARDVTRLFWLNGLYLGLLGGLLGLLIGASIALNIPAILRFLSERLGVELFDPEVFHQLAELPIRLPFSRLLVMLLLVLAAALLASAIPAWRASRTAPAEALRGE